MGNLRYTRRHFILVATSILQAPSVKQDVGQFNKLPSLLKNEVCSSQQDGHSKAMIKLVVQNVGLNLSSTLFPMTSIYVNKFVDLLTGKPYYLDLNLIVVFVKETHAVAGMIRGKSQQSIILARTIMQYLMKIFYFVPLHINDLNIFCFLILTYNSNKLFEARTDICILFVSFGP